MSDLDTAMGKLVNCCELVIHDGQQDIESACSDPGFRRAVQRASPFHRASIWVSKPPLTFKSNSVVDDIIVKNCVKIIGTLENCPMVSAVTVTCQEWLWDKVTEGLLHYRDRRRQSQWRGYRTTFIGVRSLCLILERTIYCYRRAYSRSPEVSLEYFGSFELPELVNLTVKVVPVKNRILDVTSIDDTESDCEPGYHEVFYEEQIADTHSTRSTSDSLTLDTDWRSDGADDLAEELDPIFYYHMFVEETKLKLGLSRFPKLEKLTVGNVLIDTDLLLAWCWFQPHLPQLRLTFTMVDVVVFDELALRDFFPALHSLNVELVYEYRGTGYFERSEWFHKLNIKNRRLTVESKRFLDNNRWEDYVLEERALEPMPSMSELPKLNSKMPLPSSRTDCLRVDFRLHYPWDWQMMVSDEDYLLDFWEDAEDHFACTVGTLIEEVDVMKIDDRDLCNT